MSDWQQVVNGYTGDFVKEFDPSKEYEFRHQTYGDTDIRRFNDLPHHFNRCHLWFRPIAKTYEQGRADRILRAFQYGFGHRLGTRMADWVLRYWR